MSQGKWWIGLLLLSLAAAFLVGCGVSSTTSSDLEATVQAAVEATMVAQQGPLPTQVSGAPIGPPAPGGTPRPTVQTTLGEIRRVTATELKAMVDAGEAIIVDARAKQSYRQKHIAGAISMPNNKVAERYAELPQDKHISFYCT